jgi:hypothetical protein
MIFAASPAGAGATAMQEYRVPEGHKSMILKLFCEELSNREHALALDVGPVCGDNISLLAGAVHRMYVCDLFMHLARVQKAQLPTKQTWQELTYPQATFDGILLWGLMDRLEDRQVSELLTYVRSLLKPQGLLVVLACGEHEAGRDVYTYVLDADYSVSLRYQEHLRLPLYPRHNREILVLLQDMTVVKSVIYRNGIREFLLRLK